ncbi:hypothetical protein Pen02_74320 [Plantactinospora endophytica]|uniref:DUF4233 domain-containing protein n=1 Tax=Plantactinospora endophytica TaxID=673535 RepID=A0ABQ4ECS3_9ACTN|nr:hypothetical protein Pen02_74320 [Plantactinospora endophytica]
MTSGWQPFEVTSLATAVVCGVSLVGLDSRPRSVAAAMPNLLEQIWAVGLIVAGVAGLCGVAWQGQLATALGVELGALLGFGSVTGMYAIAVFVIAGRPGIAAGLFIAALAVSSWWRCVQIVRDLHRLARAQELRHKIEVPMPVEGAARDPSSAP